MRLVCRDLTLQTTLVQVGKFSLATHSFGAPRTLVDNGSGEASLFEGGALGENYATGELAALWPQLTNSARLMRLYLSTNGGVQFSAAVRGDHR
jgi:hypothetical protein